MVDSFSDDAFIVSKSPEPGIRKRLARAIGAFSLLACKRSAVIADIFWNKLDLAEAFRANKNTLLTASQTGWRKKPVKRSLCKVMGTVQQF
jgi:glycosyltransferase A (GT-A) superfamily protein (DUF2064 family)